ncbi:hypothetical protein D9613_012497 [Agrocybe pediades]|uniref:Uncharacterized protein n=1 Tax=Agrocybe pediades TaxID=84607 RepID=A0A8H4QSR0_9AGAR|nr:hypothetical protein D9613_012497 [Agrocybe pediades]
MPIHPTPANATQHDTTAKQTNKTTETTPSAGDNANMGKLAQNETGRAPHIKWRKQEKANRKGKE